MKILTGSDATVTSPTFVGTDGHTGADTSSTPTVTATSAAGQTVTLGAVTNLDAAGVYTVTVQSLANPDLVTLVWTGAVSGVDQRLEQHIDVVGGVYVSLGELIAVPGIDLSKHSADRILELRDEFEELAEEYTGRAFVPRFAQESLRTTALLGHRDLRSIVSVVDVAEVTVDASDWILTEWGLLTDRYGASVRQYGTWPFAVKYVYGADRPPASLVSACKDYVRAQLLADNNRVARDTIRQTDPAGITEQWSTPDWSARRPTGYLKIDRVLNQIGRAPAAIA